MNFIRYIGSQFSNPRGIGGILSTFFMNRLNQRQYRSVTSAFHQKVPEPERVLDIGFGNGYLLGKMADRCNAVFYGIEVSADMVRQAEKRNSWLVQHQRLFLLRGDVASMEYSDGFFDFIYTVNTVYFWSDLEEGFLEIYRTLKDDGVFANAFYGEKWLDGLSYTKYGFAKYAPEELRHAAEKAGFRKVELEQLKRDCAYCLTAWK